MLKDGRSLQSMTTVLVAFTNSVSWLSDVISTVFDIVVRRKAWCLRDMIWWGGVIPTVLWSGCQGNA